jgi:hypothetical protein
MKKIIKMIKPVADSCNPYLPLELTIHKTSYLLTDLFLGEGQPFRKEMEKKLFKEDIENRRIIFDIGGYAEYYKDSKTGRMKAKFIVKDLWLWVCMKEHRKKQSGYNEMQSKYMQAKLEEYLHEQGIDMPSHNADETERLLKFLSPYLPCVWDYFTIREMEEKG